MAVLKRNTRVPDGVKFVAIRFSRFKRASRHHFFVRTESGGSMFIPREYYGGPDHDNWHLGSKWIEEGFARKSGLLQYIIRT